MIASSRKETRNRSACGAVHWRVWPYAALLGFYLLAAAVISIAGDFPLNDDWSYGTGVRHFVNKGTLYLPGVCAAGFAHVLWGALFVKIAGFSYESLRLAALTMSAFGSCCLLSALRILGLGRGSALVLTLIYAANPIMLNITFSFMSDSTALALGSAFLAAFLRALKQRSCGWLLLSALVLATAVTVRQSALFLAPALVMWLWCLGAGLQSVYWRWKAGLSLLFSCLLLVLALSGVESWLAHSEAAGNSLGSPYAYTKALHVDFFKLCLAQPGQQFLAILGACGQVLAYLSLFILPLWPGLLAAVGNNASLFTRLKALLPSFCFTAITCAYTVFSQHRLMPFSENIWRVTSVGALGLMGIANNPPTIRQKKWLTALAYAGVLIMARLFCDLIVLLGRLLARMRRSYGQGFRPLALLAIVLVLCSTAGFSVLETLVRSSDRYYLIALAPLLLLLAALQKYWRFRLVSLLNLLILLLFSTYSVFAVQDYLSSNRARWTVLRRLEAGGANWSGIDGGAEYNFIANLRIYESHYRGEPPRNNWRWWPITGEKYIVSFSPIPGYDLLFSEEYFSLLTMSKHPVLALKKNGAEITK